MQYRTLGKTGFKISEISLGTWQVGGKWGDPFNEQSAEQIINRAIDRGINFFDTADVYSDGLSERAVAKVVHSHEQELYIATKCGLLWNEKREKVNCLKKESISKECDTSLKRLGVDVIDLYQIHWPDPDEDIEEAWEEMAKLADEDKIAAILEVARELAGENV